MAHFLKYPFLGAYLGGRVTEPPTDLPSIAHFKQHRPGARPRVVNKILQNDQQSLEGVHWEPFERAERAGGAVSAPVASDGAYRPNNGANLQV